MEILGRCCFLGPRALKESTKKHEKSFTASVYIHPSADACSQSVLKKTEGFNYHAIMVLVFQNGLENRPPSPNFVKFSAFVKGNGSLHRNLWCTKKSSCESKESLRSENEPSDVNHSWETVSCRTLKAHFSTGFEA